MHCFSNKKISNNNVIDYEAENRDPIVYEIVELKNKEIKFKRTYSYDYNYPVNADEYSQDEILTLIPQNQDF